MKRDFDLIRRILLQIESSDPGALSGSQFRVQGHPDAVVARHVQLLAEAGLLKAQIVESEQEAVVATIVERLTWSGHEFLDSARDPDLWKKLMALRRRRGGALPFEALQEYLVRGTKSGLRRRK